MIDKTEILKEVMIYVVDVITTRHKELGMKATGDWLNSIEYKINDNTGYLIGFDYTKYLVEGREPGKRPPIDPIEEWVKAKFGITGKQSRSVAFAVANKIADSGTTWYQKGGSDLLDVLNSYQVTSKINEIAGDILKVRTRLSFQRQLQTI